MTETVHTEPKSHAQAVRFKTPILKQLQAYADQYWNGNISAATNFLVQQILLYGGMLKYPTQGK